MAAGTCKRVLGIIFCCVEMLLLSGVMFGWIYLVDVLRNDGAFDNVCLNGSSNQNNATGTVTLNDLKLAVKEDVNRQRFRRTLRSHRVGEGVGVKYLNAPNIPYIVETIKEGQKSKWTRDISLAVTSPVTSKDGWYGVLPFKGYQCEEEWQSYVFVFLAAIFGAPFLLFLIGLLYDSCGTWLVRIVAIVFIISGNLMIAFAEGDLSPLLYGGTVLVHCGGVILLLSNVQLSNFFFTTRSLVIFLIVGCYFSSSWVYLAIKTIMFEYSWIPRRYIFFVMGGVAMIPIANTFFFHSILHTEESEFGLDRYRPRETSHIKMNSKKIYRQTIRNGTLPIEGEERLQLDDSRSMTGSTFSGGTNLYIERETYCGVTCTATFILHVMWFAILQLQNWFIASVRFNLTTETVAYRDEVYNYGHICLVVLAPFLGAGMDLRRRQTGKKYDDNEIIHLKASIIPVTVTSILSLFLGGLVFVPHFVSAKETLYAIDILLLVTRYFSWSTMAVFLFQMACLAEGRDLAGMELSRLASLRSYSNIYPKLFFGRLFTVTVLIATVIGACHYPLLLLLKLVPQVKLFYIFAGLGVLVVVIFSHPVHLTVHVRNLESENEKRVMSSIWANDSNTMSTYATMNQVKRDGTATTASDLTLDLQITAL